MRLSICAVTVYPELSLVERCRAIQRHGVTNVELWGLTGINIDELEKESKAGVWRVVGFCGNQDNALIDPEKRQGFLEEFRRSIAVAKRLNCPNIAVLSDQMDPQARPIPPTRPLTQSEKLFSYYEGLSQAVRLAEREEVNLVIEPLNTRVDHQGYFLESTALGFEIIRSIASPRLKLMYDIYHMQIMEGNLIDTLEKNLDLVSQVHVADVPGRHEPGTGEINYGNIIRMLKTSGYQGYIGLECWPAGDSGKAIEAFLKLFD